MNLWVRALLGVLLGFASISLSAAEVQERWEIKSLTGEPSFVHNLNTGITVATNGVLVTYGDARLTANRLTLNQRSGDVQAEGAVTLEQDKALWQGERLEYNFLTRQIKAADYRAGHSPFFSSGFELFGDSTNHVYSAVHAHVTTDDTADPAYRIRARTLVIIPGYLIEATGATVYVGDVPVMYWPVYRKHLYRHPNYVVVTPGYRSRDGAYFLNSYNFGLGTNAFASAALDYRTRRGVAGGPGLKYDLGRWGAGDTSYYFAHDERPGIGAFGQNLQEERQRANLSHRVNLGTNLVATAVVRWQSDEFLIRDFFENEYQKNIQPATFLELNKHWRDWNLNFLAQPQVNDFFQTVERLPEVKLSGMRQQIGGLPLFYESESTAGYLRQQFANNALPEFAAMRADSWHQILYPNTFFGWLNFTPRAGGRFTYYSESDGSAVPLNEEQRAIFNTGAELSFKASRVWAGKQSKFWDLDGLRHIIQPTVNYVYIPRPNVRPALLPQFDPVIPTLWLLPIEFPDYNAIDAIDSENTIRYGLRNRLQTKRDDVVEDLLHWALYTDWHINRRAGQGGFSDAYSDFDFKPRRWITLTSENRYDVDNGHWLQAYHTLTLEPNSVWSVSLGHRYLRDDFVRGLGTGNNLVATSVYYRLNENWGLRAQHLYEARDGTMEEQYYTIYRDLRSWTSAVTFRVRDNRGGPSDFTVALTLSLKAFPRFGLGSDRVSPSLLMGG
jgi:LPS-assembly protein